MSTDAIFQVIGWAGQGFFFTRFLFQWWASERRRRIVVPGVFWWMSLCGALCTGVFALHARNLVFLASPVVNLFIYGRNIALERSGRSLGRGVLLPVALGVAALIAIALAAGIKPDDPPLWLAVGTVGQFCWISRFPVQWWVSERRGRASLPPAFFWISFLGSLLLLAYAIHTGVAVFIAGMAIGPFLYGRSLHLCYSRRGREEAPLATPEPAGGTVS